MNRIVLIIKPNSDSTTEVHKITDAIFQLVKDLNLDYRCQSTLNVELTQKDELKSSSRGRLAGMF